MGKHVMGLTARRASPRFYVQPFSLFSERTSHIALSLSLSNANKYEYHQYFTKQLSFNIVLLTESKFKIF